IEGLRRGDELKVMLEQCPETSRPIKAKMVPSDLEPSVMEFFQALDSTKTLDDNWRNSSLDRHTFYSAIKVLAEGRLLELELT
ncbi:MAG TPA: hypothetical protein V6D23_03245, partial [Candidatus Obscuribacterales bacterium]